MDGASPVGCVDRDFKAWGPTEGASSMAVHALITRPRTSALRRPSTHSAIRNVNHR